MPKRKIRIPPSLLSLDVGSMARHYKEIFEPHIRESPHVFFLQEARTTSHEIRAMEHRFREVVYFVLWDAWRKFAGIARHGILLCQIRGPECVEGYRLGYFALQLRDTRELLRNVRYPFEARLKGPDLSKNCKVLTLPVASMTLVISILSRVGAPMITSSCPM